MVTSKSCRLHTILVQQGLYAVPENQLTSGKGARDRPERWLTPFWTGPDCVAQTQGVCSRGRGVEQPLPRVPIAGWGLRSASDHPPPSCCRYVAVPLSSAQLIGAVKHGPANGGRLGLGQLLGPHRQVGLNAQREAIYRNADIELAAGEAQTLAITKTYLNHMKLVHRTPPNLVAYID
ncbi:TPA: hypothetical protein DEB00_02745 [Candidatus Uhrbacteria bacterium]|nr:hypothetical protein [Candidatus Uhrbacteria bacterium]